MNSLLAIVLMASAFVLPHANASIKISAFNIKTFGTSKMDKPEVVDKLKRIISRYDMVLIQEIRNKDGTAIVELLDEVNAFSPDTYDMVISTRMGRSSSYQEQYAYFYKLGALSVLDDFEYADDGDKFEREPYVVRFDAPATTVGQFGAIGIHVKPDDAVAEINLLTDVYETTKARWDENVVLMGDFNADCSYVSSSDWSSISLRTDPRFDWVIPDTDDTTVSGNTHCAYDRFVLAGSTLQTTSADAAPFFFDAYFGLDYYAAVDVSDHYPVEMTIN